jgi:hypothetical protein
MIIRPPFAAVAALAGLLACTGTVQATTLTGFASLPAHTFSKGPTSAQFVTPANGALLPLVRKQPVQGFSTVLAGPTADTFYAMPDNGFGAKTNSQDALLRTYAVRPDFRTFDGSTVQGTGIITAARIKDGGTLGSTFGSGSFLKLRDPEGLIGFPIVADGEFYPYSGTGPGSADIPVAKTIRSERLLTGADLDIESRRTDANGNLWFGDEFGPFLLKTDKNGRVLRSVIPMPGVQSPQNPFLGSATPTLNPSNGFEGLAINNAGDTLYTMLEGSVVGDAPGSLRINAFDIATESYTGAQWLYKLDPQGTNIGEFTTVNDTQFIVIERNGTQEPRFKRLYLIDLAHVDAEGYVQKTEIADLMHIADPNDLNADGNNTLFTFPFVTIESVLVLDAQTLLVVNDNNYPGSSRVAGVPDPTEFIKIQLDQPLPLR